MVFSDRVGGPTHSFQRATKRLFDIIIATLVVLSPLILLVSLAIKLDSRGPIFSIHARHSYTNRRVHVLRFRNTAIQPSDEDSSPTRMGRILRCVEGLPMLLNVLVGEMSIVGPCLYTTPPGLLNEHTLGPAPNNEFKPGLTGWAQVRTSARHETSQARLKRMEDDLFYILNWSLTFDARIIWMSLLCKHFYLLD
jgi:lipopolysaccharide/colanic/teichoic acid biosynthesis glycosyltransferase